jgi:hypothetical protein
VRTGALGKLPHRRIVGLPMLATYKRAIALPPPPIAVDWYSKVTSWPLDGNDSLGDCTCVGVAAAIQQWTTYTGAPKVLTTGQVISFYEKFGYVPGKPDTDQGAVEADVLSTWRDVGIEGDKLDGFVSLNPINLNDIRDSVNWFGNAYLGISLPIAAQNMDMWDVPAGQKLTGDWEPGSWGGHCVVTPGYDAQVFRFNKWGELGSMTPAFMSAYLDEAYGLLNHDFITGAGTTPAGLSLAQLEDDQEALKS